MLATLDGVDYRRDDFGNIIASYTAPSVAALPEAEREPPIAFVAHMDHPGYEIFLREEAEADRSSDAPQTADADDASGRADDRNKKYIARALGGVPVASMTKPTPAFVPTPDGERIPAEIRPLDADSSEDGAGERLASVHVKSDAELTLPAPVVFDLPDFAIDGRHNPHARR